MSSRIAVGNDWLKSIYLHVGDVISFLVPWSETPRAGTITRVKDGTPGIVWVGAYCYDASQLRSIRIIGPHSLI